MSMPTVNIRKGDTVQIISGREKGKTGKVLTIVERQRVIVEKLNLVKRHTKPSQKNQAGGLVDKEAALHISKVLLLCAKCNKGVRVARKRDKDGLTRICKKCGGKI